MLYSVLFEVVLASRAHNVIVEVHIIFDKVGLDVEDVEKVMYHVRFVEESAHVEHVSEHLQVNDCWDPAPQLGSDLFVGHLCALFILRVV